MTLYIAQEGARQTVEDGTKWWSTPYGRWRLAAEDEAMRRRFPGFRLCHLDHGNLAWRGRLRSGMKPRTRYLVEVEYPERFPDSAPEVAILKPQLPRHTPHLLFERKPCLFRWDGPRTGYDPARTTAATLVAWTALWIHAYETWRATGFWPGAEA